MANNNNKTIKAITLLLTGLALCACSNSDQEPAQAAKPDATTPTATISPDTSIKPTDSTDITIRSTPLTAFYLNLAQQHFDATCSSIKQLQQSVQGFVSQPSEEGLSVLKSEWLVSHNHYASTQLFRNITIKHPTLDHSQTEPVQHALAVRIDQTPLLPGYIDEIEGYPNSGYIFSTLPIDRATLNKEHQFADSAYVAMGYHALEFLLWGEDNRTHQAFAPLPATEGESAEENPALFNIRRSKLLSLITDLLAEDLSTLCAEWQPIKGFYVTKLQSLPTEQQYAAINAATEELISNLQINTAKVRQANDDNAEYIEIEPHSTFSNSDKDDTQAQLNTLKALIESDQWKETEKKQEHTQKLSQLAKALLL
ncbi:imelysin family protein [Alkalimarinus sediminis]|uniref:Imelysin-like domain-containing protein n=1 Tax=Alkalimarinus sediminis TaxID=1632866 RepID=A0A9E8HJX0_9ALTE|nr:imelysin family protein [Alkalimarinus sediminis]UZW74043.1 hypothetical protein NNL22_13530 [Alkalimarinus sediminis]